MVVGTGQYASGEKIRRALEIPLGREKMFTTRSVCRGAFQHDCAEKKCSCSPQSHVDIVLWRLAVYFEWVRRRQYQDMEGACQREDGCSDGTRARSHGIPRGTEAKVERGQGGWTGHAVCPATHFYYFWLMSPCSMRHLPKSIRSTSKLKLTMEEAQRVKEERRRKHTREGEQKPKAARKKVVLTEQK